MLKLFQQYPSECQFNVSVSPWGKNNNNRKTIVFLITQFHYFVLEEKMLAAVRQ